MFCSTDRPTGLILTTALIALLGFIPGLCVSDSVTAPDNKPLLLEIRYCECAASRQGVIEPEQLASYLAKSHAVNVGVASNDRGFISTRHLAFNYAIEPIEGQPDSFYFQYTGSHVKGQQKREGQGTLKLSRGEWINLFGSRSHTGNEDHVFEVMVRLAKHQEK